MKNYLFNIANAMTRMEGTGPEVIATTLDKFVKKLLAPIFTVIGVAGVLYAIYLGVMYAKAESADKRKEVQGRLIGAIIGAVIIVVGAVLCYSLKWYDIFKGFAAANDVSLS